ncbi:hypothetical protein EJ06DRAFT_533684 [Trichodelitschia bisporula]|uniref:Protein Zds1 C-terminal domain-containing protein n=1 Tax=Trichodelitschia bisporula TaxID=703511 RepID=A0A6G1HMA5_9PEZI|nr:hypothetical protein EJ06DRAFT_533684 [Trichodelitschia bisporula]
MQASQRARELERVYQARRGHAPKISISDDNHHVTEAIGDMYGSDEFTSNRNSRPLSFLPSPLGDTFDTVEKSAAYYEPTTRSSPLASSSSSRSNFLEAPSSERRPPPSERITTAITPPKPGIARSESGGNLNGQSHNGSLSPPQAQSPGQRSPPETAGKSFPLPDIDYESNPAAVAQELSNLQAIRRMSMDVHASDPDLPSFGSSWGVPPVAPSPDADEEDPSRLFWVPARLHPELAPVEFKTFIQDRAKTIKRSSLSDDALSPNSTQSGSLRRKKSMLSRQVNDGTGYEDGAERLERKRSGHAGPDRTAISLHQLENLVNDPSGIARRMSIDSPRPSMDSGSDASANEDVPILPPKPAGSTLKRSTRTTYRRGSLKKGERVPYSRRAALRNAAEADEESGGPPQLPALPDLEQLEGAFGLTRVQTDPLPQPRAVENFSRPGRRARTPPMPHSEFDRPESPSSPPPDERAVSPPHSHYVNSKSSPSLPVPTIIETPPPASDHSRAHSLPTIQHPERTSSHPERSSSIDPHQPPSQPPTGPLPSRPARPPLTRPGTLEKQHRQPSVKSSSSTATLDDMASHPSPLPVSGMRTDSLSIIPTYTEEKKGDRKSKEKKDESSGRKTSWGWLRGNEDKEKEKDQSKKKDKRDRLQKPTEKQPQHHDNTRLDVLQSSIDGNPGRSRESVVLDRREVQLEVEFDKRPVRKASHEGRKEKEEKGLFSSLFGGSKKSRDRDSHSKKSGSSLRGVSPDPGPAKRLRPDVDYNWSRFSIFEERAIYRLAHIKLANPRRELYSQVLLSNFMYSYLAKVQQMHPQIQMPQSAAQKSAARQAQQQQQNGRSRSDSSASQSSQSSQQPAQQSEEFAQYQRYQEQQARLDSSGDAAGPGVDEDEERGGRPEDRYAAGGRNGDAYTVSSSAALVGGAGGYGRGA